MGHISGGTVSFMKRVKTGDYEHAETTATINFSVQDGENAAELLDLAGKMAYRKVYELLEPKPSRLAGLAKDLASPENLAKIDAATTPAEPKKRPGRPPGPRKAAPVADPAAMDEDPTREAENSPKSVEDDPLADILTAPAAEITDTDLTNAVTAKNGSLIKKHGKDGTTKIRELMAEFLKSGQSLMMIPEPVRQQFLDKLDKLA